MESLNDIGLSEGTDKSGLIDRSSAHYAGHHYCDLYELLFKNRINNVTSLLEIGVLDGGSIRMWKRYFPFAHITAIDVNDRINFADDKRVEFIHGDSYSDEVISKLHYNYDIIIDDGDHQLASQRIFLQRYPALLSADGILIVEDVLTRDGAMMLKAALPAGFNCAIVEMSEGSSIIDSRMMIVYRV